MTTTLNLDLRRLANIASDLAERRDAWPDVQFDSDHRWYARLPVDEPVEAWLLSWLPGQGTGLHDHGDAAGAFFVVRGLLRETTVIPTSDDRIREAERMFAAGQGRSFGQRHLHEIVNRGRVPAVSVHVYTPTLTAMALTTMRRYHRVGDLLVQTAVENAGENW